MARARNIPVIAFSTDANVASSGVYLLSFLPESDVERIVQYAASTGKRSYAALMPDNPYGTVVEAAFKQAVARRGGQIVALERYPHDKAAMAAPVKTVALSGGARRCPLHSRWRRRRAGRRPGAGRRRRQLKSMQLLGTGLWDDPRVYATPALDGGWYAAPDAAGFRSFAGPLPRPLQSGPGAHGDACL